MTIVSADPTRKNKMAIARNTAKFNSTKHLVKNPPHLSLQNLPAQRDMAPHKAPTIVSIERANAIKEKALPKAFKSSSVMKVFSSV